MNFLDRLVIPESHEHLTLLKYLLVLVNVLFITYSSIALIASTVAAFLDARGRKHGEKIYSRFAGNLMDLATPNRGAIVALVVIPLITAVLIYAQIFRGMSVGITGYTVLASCFYFFGFYFLYAYKKSFHLDVIYKTFQRLAESSEVDSGVASEVESYEHTITNTRMKFGRRGAILLWIGTWIFLGASSLAFTPDRWQASSFLMILFSGDTFWSIINYIVSAFILTSAAVIFFFFKWENGIALFADEDYRSLVKRYALPIGIISAAIEPVLILFDIKNLPQTVISTTTFGLAGAALFVALFLIHIFYSMLKDAKVNLGSYAFVAGILLIFLLAAKDEVSLRHATEVQDQIIEQRYAAMLAELNPNEAAVVISGEDIFNGRCSACHRFDIRLVGPPYNQTLPNFVGKMDSLEDFIISPRQVVPGYPPMPAQGLKPAEVKAVAEYIMGIYLKSHPQDTLRMIGKKPV